MPRLKSFPDLDKHFQLMKIKDHLLALNPDDGFFQMCLVKSVEAGKLTEAVKTVKEQAADNRQKMANLIGWDLLEMIEKI